MTFVCTPFKCESFIWLIDKTLPVATPLWATVNLGAIVMKGVLHIPQSSSITGTSPSDCLESYLGYSLVGESYPFAEIQSIYSTATADWANQDKCSYSESVISGQIIIVKPWVCFVLWWVSILLAACIINNPKSSYQKG